MWFYGESCHENCGLADTKLSFQCKQQLRHEIISNGTWFYNSEEMADFLKQYLVDPIKMLI